MKTIFYTLNVFESHSNVNIEQHYPKAENIIYKPDKQYESFMSIYFNIIRNNEGKIQMYYRSAPKNINNMFCKYAPFTQFTAYAESDDGITFNKPDLTIHKYMKFSQNNIILKEGMASTNFIVFYDNNVQKYRGIGGGHNDYISLKKNGNHLPECVKNSKYIEKSMGIFTNPLDPSVEHSCRVNGLYLWESDDGINWTIQSKKPFINGFHEGGCDRPVNGKVGISPFDGLPSILYDDKRQEYRLYVRGNPKPDIRHIQYTTSKDFVNWKPLKFINITPEFNYSKDNYYYPCIKKYPNSNQYIALFPYYDINNKYKFSTYLAFSNNGIDWTRLNKVIDKEYVNSVDGIILSNDNTEMYIYLQENYMDIHRKVPRNNVRRYSIRMDGFTSITSGKLKGTFLTKKMKLCDFNLNFQVYHDGYIHIKVLNRHRDIIEEHNVMEFDKLSYHINIHDSFHNNNGYLEFHIYKAHIYSINFL
jgi:hypothetical protein